jgi:diguanylate cyclase (GGDEF)-like protein/PAS domain S-box-containing protein
MDHTGPLRAGVSDHFHKTLVDNLTEGVYYVDRDREITYWNHGAERLTGYAAADVVGHHCYSNILAHVDVTGEQLCLSRCPLAASLSDGTPREAEVWLRHRDGHRHPVTVRCAAILDEETGEVIGAVETFHDRSAIVRARDEAGRFRRQALSDPGTGLPNRRALEMELAGRLEDFAAQGRELGLLMIDIDRFKLVNDTYGHVTGDIALEIVAATLSGGARAGEFLGRWGGEEFVVLLEDVGRLGVAIAGERLRALVERSLVHHEAAEIHVTVSIGGAVARSGDDATTLLERADAALYEAKQGGRNRVMLEP